jgi:acetyl-CoA C-acetyltransferase
MVPVTERDQLDDAEGAVQAALAALDAAQLSSEQLDLVDLYSCYPAAVRAHAEALRISEGVPLTVTGGMRFAGGPYNNYVLHATGQVALKLRAGEGTFGAVSSVSGMLTKHAVGIWSSHPNPSGFESRDVTAQVERQTGRRRSRPDLSGPATVAGYTVLCGRGRPNVAVAVLDGHDGARVIARSEDPEIVKDFSGHREQCGRRVTVTSGVFGPSGAVL